MMYVSPDKSHAADRSPDAFSRAMTKAHQDNQSNNFLHKSATLIFCLFFMKLEFYDSPLT